MAAATIAVRIAFASNPFDAVPTWTDITNDCVNLDIRRGRQHELDRMECGTASLMIKNIQGNYWPNNASGAYYPNVKPAKMINIQATYGGSTYDIYTGFIEAWLPFWLDVGGQIPCIQLECADLIKYLSRLYLNDGAGYAQELSGTRIGNVLDDLGWPAGARDLDAGKSTMQATGAIADENAMEHLLLVQLSEEGIMFIAGDGDVQFQDRHARLKAPYTTSQAIFGDDGGEHRYRFMEPSYDDQHIYNDIAITRAGGLQQTSTDATSQTAYGKRSLSRTGLLMTVDTEALAQAGWLKNRFKDAHMRSRQLEIYPDHDPANLWPKVLNYDISTRFTVRRNEASIDEDYHIEGIIHSYDAREDLWSTTWQLSNADAEKYWLIGVAGFSEIGETTKVCY